MTAKRTIPVYLDNHATTRVDPRVVEAMVPFLSEHYGNAASTQHQFGWTAGAAVKNARTGVANLIGASADEIVFASGATESINLALKGVAEGYARKGKHVIVAATEHKAVLDTCMTLERRGFGVTILPVDHAGWVSPDVVKEAITDETILVSIMMANNEIGTIAPIAEIGAICRDREVLFHSDASQAIGKVPLDVSHVPVDLLSFTAHKMYGPKGIGALYVRKTNPRLKIAAQMDGGGHERGLRSGTLNVPAIVGFGVAASIAAMEITDEAVRVKTLRDSLIERLHNSLAEVHLNGHPTSRLANNASMTFVGTNADQIMLAMTDIAVSTGSACSSDAPGTSHVLRAIGLSDDDARSTIRFGLGRFTTGEEIDYASHRVVEAVKTVREKSRRLQLSHIP